MACLIFSGIALSGTGCAGNRYQRSTGAYIDDKAISTRVKTALFRDPNVSGFDVHVNTFRGDVQLSGFVDTPEQKEHAAAIAREVAGVRSVTDNLEVKPRPAMGTTGAAVENSSRTVTEVPANDRLDDRSRLNDNDRLAPADAQTPLSTARNIEITSVNGRATLRGFVSSEDEKRTIARKLLSVPGVVTVDNQLEVQPIAPVK